MSVIPTVSVIIPVFNGERYIRQTIESVLAQTYRDFELVIVDDGSTDGTTEVVKHYEHNVRYISQANGGASKARNQGICMSRGRYIAFQDADDLWDPNKLAIQAEFLDNNPDIGLVHCDCDGIDEEGKTFIRWKNSGREEGLYRLFTQGHAVGVFSAMFRRALLARSGLFDEDFPKAGLEDSEFMSRLSEITRFHCIPKTLVKHRVHPYSTCRTFANTSIPLEHRALMLDKMMSRFAGEPERRKFLEGEMVSYRSDLGKRLLVQGRVADGRKELWDSVLLNLKGPRDPGKLVRSILRLIRSARNPRAEACA